jgi:hypothetical protein
MVPPSLTYSLPVMDAARGETRNAIRSATSLGFATQRVHQALAGSLLVAADFRELMGQIPMALQLVPAVAVSLSGRT